MLKYLREVIFTELTFIHFLIVCPLVFLAGFVDAIAGGGGLISLPAYLLSGLPTHFAIGTNKLSSFMGTAVSTGKYALSGFIPWKLALFCIVFAFGGSFCGSSLELLIPDLYFKIIILFVLPVSLVFVLKKKTLSEKEPFSFIKTAVISALSSLIVGFYDGFYGPGTGMFLILLFSGVAHLSLGRSNGLAKIINLATNSASVIVFLSEGKALLPLGLVAGVFGIAGNYLGASLFSQKGARWTRPVMIFVIVLLFIKVIYEMFA